VNGATVTTTDLVTDNGIIHVIDAALTPPAERGEPTSNIVETAIANGYFQTLVAAVQTAGLVDTLANPDASFTVFAPTDTAFEMIDPATLEALIADTDALSSVLLQHVVEGEVDSVTAFSLNGQIATNASGAMIPVGLNPETDTLAFGGANVVITDIYTTNGIIHVLDMVVVGDVELPTPPQSIADVARENGNFTTLVAALEATGLDSVLADTDTDFTVFAPTDDAFALLGEQTITALLADTDTLSNILLNHVVSGTEIGSLNAYAANGANLDTVAMEDVSVALVNFTATMEGETSEVAYDAENQRLVGGAASDFPGFTLYTFDGDLGTSSSACIDGCATTWPPVLVADGDVSSVPGLGTIMRGDDTVQATYLGRPLYF